MALAHALSSKVKDDAILVLDKAELKEGKTKDLSAKLAKLGLSNALIIGGTSVDENFAKAARNLIHG